MKKIFGSLTSQALMRGQGSVCYKSNLFSVQSLILGKKSMITNDHIYIYMIFYDPYIYILMSPLKYPHIMYLPLIIYPSEQKKK